jgi:hypothetical protein
MTLSYLFGVFDTYRRIGLFRKQKKQAVEAAGLCRDETNNIL